MARTWMFLIGLALMVLGIVVYLVVPIPGLVMIVVGFVLAFAMRK